VLGRSKRIEDEIDRAAERIIEILKSEVQPIDLKEGAELKQIQEVELKGKVDALARNEVRDTETLNHKELSRLLDPLGNKLDEIEDTMTRTTPMIEAVLELAPKLDRIKDLLHRDIQMRQRDAEEVTNLVLKTEELKKNLQEVIGRKQKDMEQLENEILENEVKIRQISDELPKLVLRKEEIEKVMNKEKENAQRVDQHLKRISRLRRTAALRAGLPS